MHRLIAYVFMMQSLLGNLIIGFPHYPYNPLQNMAPLSQIKWNTRENWRHTFHPVDLEPRSYHIQHRTFQELASNIDHHINHGANQEESFESEKIHPEDQLVLPSHIEFMVSHPEHYRIIKTSNPSSKSLQISYEPLTKLKITDTLLDAFEAFTPETLKKAATTKRPIRTTVQNKLPPPKNKPNNKPQTKPNKIPKQNPGSEVDEENETPELVSNVPSSTPISVPLRPNNNHLAGQSQIGNRESQMVIKPTVIVNIRGTVSNTDSDISVSGRANDDNSTNATVPAQNVFNINQEVNIEKTYSVSDEDGDLKSVQVKNNKTPKTISVEVKESREGDDVGLEMNEEQVGKESKVPFNDLVFKINEQLDLNSNKYTTSFPEYDVEDFDLTDEVNRSFFDSAKMEIKAKLKNKNDAIDGPKNDDADSDKKKENHEILKKIQEEMVEQRNEDYGNMEDEYPDETFIFVAGKRGGFLNVFY